MCRLMSVGIPSFMIEAADKSGFALAVDARSALIAKEGADGTPFVPGSETLVRDPAGARVLPTVHAGS